MANLELRLWEKNKEWLDLDIQVIPILDISYDEKKANEIALKYAKKYETEIRWNWENSGQGYYVGTEYKFKKLENEHD